MKPLPLSTSMGSRSELLSCSGLGKTGINWDDGRHDALRGLASSLPKSRYGTQLIFSVSNVVVSGELYLPAELHLSVEVRWRAQSSVCHFWRLRCVVLTVFRFLRFSKLSALRQKPNSLFALSSNLVKLSPEGLNLHLQKLLSGSSSSSDLCPILPNE